jgi:alcohol dehydrogenase class IV
MDINVNALKRAQDPSGVLQRYEEIAKILCHSTNASVEDGIEWVYDLVEDLEIPKLSTYKITPDDFPTIISKAGRSSSMRGNPIQLSEEELTEIMYRAL